MPIQWYALHSHPHKEDLLWHQIESRGIEVFYPRVKVPVVNPRARRIRPYFPGYLFVHVDLEQTGISMLNWMPYSTGLVSFGGEPSIVSEALIHALEKRIDQINAVGGEVFDNLKPGDPVVIQDGPFAGYEAIFDIRLSGSERVRVLLKLLSSRNLPLELQAGQIRKRKTPRS